MRLGCQLFALHSATLNLCCPCCPCRPCPPCPLCAPCRPCPPGRPCPCLRHHDKNIIFGILAPSAFRKYSICLVFSELWLCLCPCICLCLCLCLCIEVNIVMSKGHLSQPINIHRGNLNLNTFTHSSWNFFCLCHCLCYCNCLCPCISLYDRTHRPYYINISFQGSGRILGWFKSLWKWFRFFLRTN